MVTENFSIKTRGNRSLKMTTHKIMFIKVRFQNAHFENIRI